MLSRPYLLSARNQVSSYVICFVRTNSALEVTEAAGCRTSAQAKERDPKDVLIPIGHRPPRTCT